MKLSHTWLLALLVGAIVSAAALGARAEELEAGQRMKILMRILTYDHKLETRQDKGAVYIAVLFAPGDKASVKEKDAVLAALGALKSLKVKGLALDFAAIPYKDAASLESALAARRAASLYVCAGLAPAIGAIKSLAVQSKIATMSGSETLTQGGLAFAAVSKGGKGQIIVNLKVCKEQGLDLDAALLGLAVVLR
jgi:hypothetical protein